MSKEQLELESRSDTEIHQEMRQLPPGDGRYQHLLDVLLARGEERIRKMKQRG